MGIGAALDVVLFLIPVEIFIALSPRGLLLIEVRMRQTAQADTPSPSGFIVGILYAQQAQHCRDIVRPHAVLQSLPTIRAQRPRVRQIRVRAIRMQPCQFI